MRRVFHSESGLKSSPVTVSSSGAPERLSRRERQVLHLLVRGFSWAEAALALRLTVADIEAIHSAICGKLQLSSQPVMYEYAAAIGLVNRKGEQEGLLASLPRETAEPPGASRICESHAPKTPEQP